GDEPALAGVAAPQPAREIRGRAARAADHDEPASHPAMLPDHATPSFSALVVDDARFVTSVGPATSASIPQRRNVEYPSRARLTIGSPATLNDVLSSTGIPLRRPYASSSAYSRGAIWRSSVWTRAEPSTWVIAASLARHSGRT